MTFEDRTDVVAAVKADLEARGVGLGGACGAFEITRRVAWQLRESGAGVLRKTTGNNCNGFAVDIVCWRDGSYVDILIDAGNANGPAWQLHADLIDASRWAAPEPVGDAPAPPVPAPPPPPAPPAPPDPDDEIEEQILTGIDNLINAVEALAHGVIELRDRLDNIGKSGVRIHL